MGGRESDEECPFFAEMNDFSGRGFRNGKKSVFLENGMKIINN